MRSTFAVLIALAAALALAACGGDDESETATEPTTTETTTTTQEPEPQAEKPKPDKPSGSEIVATCADLFGQDTASTGAPVQGFVACLKRLGAPPDVIAAWGG